MTLYAPDGLQVGSNSNSALLSLFEPVPTGFLLLVRPSLIHGLLLLILTHFVHQIILLEEFDDLTSVVDCKGEDGLMSLTFKDKAAFDYALKTWNYINEKEDSKFLVIANHDGCGPDDQRQPYLFVQSRLFFDFGIEKG